MRYYVQAVVAEVQTPAHYGDEESTLNPFKMLLTFPVKLTRAFIRRILCRYFIHDFTACSLFIVVGWYAVICRWFFIWGDHVVSQ